MEKLLKVFSRGYYAEFRVSISKLNCANEARILFLRERGKGKLKQT